MMFLQHLFTTFRKVTLIKSVSGVKINKKHINHNVRKLLYRFGWVIKACLIFKPLE